MARPNKNTVDYFPHDCHQKKELEIFINKHGNEGYAFYYRLFELLGVTPDHQYDCSKSIDYHYLLTKTGVKEDIFEQLMITLVDLDIVEKELWKSKVIWVQSFVDSIAVVYAKRTADLPTIDSYGGENTSFRSRNPQSKEKKTKVKESGVKNSPHSKLPNWVDEIGDEYPRVDVRHVYMRYKHNCDTKGKTVDKKGFSMWVMEDDREGRNLKKKKTKTHTTLHCVKCDFSNEVPVNKTFGHLCEECGDQMVGNHELESFRKNIKKVG